LRRTERFCRERVQDTRPSSPTEHMVLLGNFNLHHPLWDEEHNMHLFTRSNLDNSQALIDILAEYDLQMALPKGIPTLQVLSTGNFTRPDNVFPPLVSGGAYPSFSRNSCACAAIVVKSLFIFINSLYIGSHSSALLALVWIWLGWGCGVAWLPVPAVVGIENFSGGGRVFWEGVVVNS